MKVKAAVIFDQGLPRPYAKSKAVKIEQVDLSGPKETEVMVQVAAAGVCHSDLSAVNGNRARPVPMVLGHEGAGVVVEVGALAKDISNYKFKIDIKSNRFKDNIIEIQTTLALEPRESNLDKIDALVTYSTLVELDKDFTDKKKLEEIILVKIPTEVYPELRKVFIFIFESSGFREIKIDPNVDFKKLYLSRQN